VTLPRDRLRGVRGLFELEVDAVDKSLLRGDLAISDVLGQRRTNPLQTANNRVDKATGPATASAHRSRGTLAPGIADRVEAVEFVGAVGATRPINPQ